MPPLTTYGVTQSGNITKDDKGMYNLRYNDFLAPMVKAIQEQQKIIEELQKNNADLVKRIEALEK